jgi:hypothetical protein
MVNCPRCGAEIETPSDGVERLEDLVVRAVPPTTRFTAPATDETLFLVVARGHRELISQIQSLVGDMGWVKVIEDRRRDETLLPRTGREGAPWGTALDR